MLDEAKHRGHSTRRQTGPQSPLILRRCAVTGAGPHVPTAGERRGRKSVGEFFRIVGESVDFSRFEPREFVAQGDKVVALGHYAAKTPSGRGFESDFVMVFTVRNGKIVQFQEFSDSAAINAAYDAVTV